MLPSDTNSAIFVGVLLVCDSQHYLAYIILHQIPSLSQIHTIMAKYEMQ